MNFRFNLLFARFTDYFEPLCRFLSIFPQFNLCSLKFIFVPLCFLNFFVFKFNYQFNILFDAHFMRIYRIGSLNIVWNIVQIFLIAKKNPARRAFYAIGTLRKHKKWQYIQVLQSFMYCHLVILRYIFIAYFVAIYYQSVFMVFYIIL